MKTYTFRLSSQITISAFILVVLGALGLFYFQQSHLRGAYLLERQANMENALQIERLRLEQAVATLRKDVLFLADIPPISGIIRATRNHGRDPVSGETVAQWTSRLENIFSAFSNAHPNYYKIRYIGMADGGRELVRIDNRNGKAEITPQGALQYKGRRYYVEEAALLRKGEVFLSRFDLARENGVIQQPKRPNLRAATPVFTPSGEVYGVVVISMDAEDLLHAITLNPPRGYSAYVTNRQGQYLFHPEPSHSFEFELGGQRNIMADFPVMQSIFDLKEPDTLSLQSVVERSGGQYLTSKRVHYDPNDPKQFLLLALEIPHKVVSQEMYRIPNRLIVGGLLSVLLVCGAVLIVLRRTFRPLAEITAAAGRIIDGDHRQLPETMGGEIGTLSKALNHMLIKLLQREDEFRRELAESLPGIFYILDPSGQFLLWNRRLETVLHASSDEIANSHAQDFVLEEDRARIEAAIRKVFESGEITTETVLVAKDGGKTPYHLSGRRVIRNGATVLVGFGMDISEQQRILHEVQALLHRNEALMANSLEGIHILDIEGNVIKVNDAFCTMLGYTREETLKLNVADWDRRFTREKLGENSRNMIGISTQFETFHRRKDGSLIEVEVTLCGVECDGTGYLYAASRDITRRKLLETVLKKYKLVIDSANDGFWVTDRSGLLLDANAAYAKLSGYTIEELIGMHISQLDAFDRPEDVLARAERIIAQGHERFDTQHRHKDGHHFDIEVSVTFMADAQEFFVFCRDITQRKIAERVLHQNKIIIETTNDGFWLIHSDGHLLGLNQAYADMVGYEYEELIGKHISELCMIADTPEQVAENLQQVMDHGHMVFKTQHRRKDGSIVDLEVSLSYLEQDQTLFGFLRDITERNEAERILKESELYNRTLFERSPIGLALSKMDGTLVDANAAFAKIIGRSIEEAMGLTYWEITPKSYAEQEKELLRQLSQSGHYGPYEKEYIHKDGHLVAVRLSGLIINRQSAQYIWSSVEDISARKEAEEALRIAAAAFETHEAIVITDAQANIVRVNRAFSEITGYRPEEVVGKNPNIMHSGRHDRDFYLNMWQRLLHDGVWAGEVWDRRKNGEVYPKWTTITAVKDECQETTHYVAIFSDITARKRIEEEIHNLAFYDALTTLPNRRLFLDRLHTALTASERHNDYGAVLFIDLDRFKVLNDELGHEYGDLLLIEVGKRIKASVRDMDTVARFGGDEFVVLLEALSAEQDDASEKVALVAEKIRVALARPYLLKGHEHHSSPSIGVSLYRGTDAPLDSLIEHADMAMYQAKSAGRNTVRFFDPVMQQNAATHDALHNDLHYAIELRQLQLHYQVQVDRNDNPLGAEAFLRWVHPQRGIIMPGQFLPIAEKSTLVIDISRWVLHTACHQLSLWSAEGITQHLTLTINISPKHFGLPDFVDEVIDTLETHRANPARLKMELSEKLALTEANCTLEKIHALKKIGVRITMDNFNTVYSSLSFIRELSADQIKIHQAFVQGITKEGNDARLVQTIIDLAKSMDMEVFAEGVETEGQRSFLKQHDCNSFQGYLFGKPVSIEEFATTIRNVSSTSMSHNTYPDT